MPRVKAVMMPPKYGMHEPTEDICNEADDGTDQTENQTKRASNQSHNHSKNSSTYPNTDGKGK